MWAASLLHLRFEILCELIVMVEELPSDHLQCAVVSLSKGIEFFPDEARNGMKSNKTEWRLAKVGDFKMISWLLCQQFCFIRNASRWSDFNARNMIDASSGVNWIYNSSSECFFPKPRKPHSLILTINEIVKIWNVVHWNHLKMAFNASGISIWMLEEWREKRGKLQELLNAVDENKNPERLLGNELKMGKVLTAQLTLVGDPPTTPNEQPF